MFFVVQSNDSFSFLLGWIKYIVVVTWQLISILKLSVHAYLTELIPTLRFSMYTIHILTWESWFLLWASHCTLSWQCWFPLWDSQCRQLLERADFHFEILTAYLLESVDFHFEILSAITWRTDFHSEILNAQLLGELISTLRFSMHAIHTLTWESWFPLWDSLSWFSPPWLSAMSRAFHCRILKTNKHAS